MSHRVLSVGSADVYGVVTEAELPLTEDSPLRPASPYAASKVAADFLGLQAFLGQGLGVIRVRAFNHLGPGQTDRFVAPALAARIAANERDGGDTVDRRRPLARAATSPTCATSCAPTACSSSAARPARSTTCAPAATSPCRSWPTTCSPSPATRCASRPIPPSCGPVDIPVLRGDATKLRDATGWQPEIPIDQTLADLLDDQRQRIVAVPHLEQR